MTNSNTDNDIIATVVPSSPSTPNIGDVVDDNDVDNDGVSGFDDDDDDEIDVNEPLEVDYGDDDDDDDDIDDDDGDAGVGEFKISLRTGAIMSSYRDFIGNNTTSADNLERGRTNGGSVSESYSLDPFNRIGSQGSNKSLDDIEISSGDAGMSLEEYYAELGVTPRGRAGGGNRFNNTYMINNRKKRYFKTFFKSAAKRRNKRGILMVVLFVSLIGIIIGIIHHAKTRNLPDWQGQLDEILQQNAIKDLQLQNDGKVPNIPTFDVHNVEMNARLTAHYQKYEPQWFHRGGNNGYTGTTYQDAINYCHTKKSQITNQQMTLCPYDAICPMGPKISPAIISLERENKQLSPMIDKPGTWIHLGGKEVCTADVWTTAIAEVGVGVGKEKDITKHVMCCIPSANNNEKDGVADQIIKDTEKEMNEVSSTTTATATTTAVHTTVTMTGGSISQLNTQLSDSYHKYEARWFTRSTGWDGSTLNEGMEFCASKTSQITKQHMTICPYDAMCPLGPLTQPEALPIEFATALSDDTSGEAAQRSPILDKTGPNPIWVSLNGEKKCTGTMWETTTATTAENEFVDDTAYIMCCILIVVADQAGSDGVGSSSINTNNNEPVAVIDTVDGTDTEDTTTASSMYDEVKLEYRPVLYDKESGWVGTTYDAAYTYCSSHMRNGEKLRLCPYEAYCPRGPTSVPYGGFIKDQSGIPKTRMLAPIYNNRDWWVDIGSENSCTLHEEIPTWGLVGTYQGKAYSGTDAYGDETVPERIMCCGGDKSSWHVGNIPDLWTLPTTISTSALTNDATATTTTTTTTTATATAPVMENWGAISATTTIAASTSEELGTDTLLSLVKKYSPSKWDRTNGWLGKTYSAALEFCASKGYVPCSYEAYCPLGPGKHVVGGVISTTSYAPLMSIPNGWVSIGPDQTCMPYNAVNTVPPLWGLKSETTVNDVDITGHIMCCAEPIVGSGLYPTDLDNGLYEMNIDAQATTSLERSEAEQSVIDMYHPTWYSHRQGYHGTTIDEAEEFCNNAADKTLCPLEAVCPDGPPSESTHKAIFLDRLPFDGEQWTPTSGRWEGDDRPDWVVIGTIGGATANTGAGTCTTLSNSQNVVKMWDGSSGRSEHKQFVLCCKKQNSNVQDNVEEILKNSVHPIWYSESDGWSGETLDDGVEFCKGRNGQELCSYPAYCPYGFSQPVMGGHMYDFDTEGEQWAPASNGMWVMIGQKFRNSATTCTMYSENEGLPPPPSWAANDGTPNLKKHIMCCRSSL